MTKNANFGPNLVVSGHKILILTGESKRFGTDTTEKPPKHLVCIVSGRYGIKWAKNANIWPKMTKNAYFGQSAAVFGPNSLIFQEEATVLVFTYGKTQLGRHLIRIVLWQGMGPNGPKTQYLTKNAYFGPNFAVLGPKIHFCGRE